MVYIFIDESGDIGTPTLSVNSKDFSLCASICKSEDIEVLNNKLKKFIHNLNKKEIRFSRLSKKEFPNVKSFIEKLEIGHFLAYRKKTEIYHGKSFLGDILKELMVAIPTFPKEKIVIFIDGTENAQMRKLCTPIIRKRFPKATLKFANSIKTPLIQVADFYAGQRRKSGK